LTVRTTDRNIKSVIIFYIDDGQVLLKRDNVNTKEINIDVIRLKRIE